MEPDSLFVQTLEDLHRSINSLDEYEVLRASHLIRQLLLDGNNSLIDRVNRTYRLKIEYFVTEVSLPVIPGLPQLGFWCAADGIAPHMSPPGSLPIALRWDKFQKMVVASCAGHHHTVYDIIDYLAHVAGGVHMSAARNEPQRVLLELQSRMPGMVFSCIVRLLRAIGRVVLVGLSDLKDRVLGVNQFEDGPGLSVYSALALAPMPGGRENYIFDIGFEEGRNRVTIFLDAHGELCVRIFSASRKMLMLRAGVAGGAYRYDELMYIGCEIGQQGEAVLVNVDCVGWNLSRVFFGTEGPIFSDPIHYVIGSDISGRCQTHMRIMELCVVKNVPTNENRRNTRRYFSQQLAGGYGSAVEYKPGSFHHSIGHPNFLDMGPTGNTSPASSASPAPP